MMELKEIPAYAQNMLRRIAGEYLMVFAGERTNFFDSSVREFDFEAWWYRPGAGKVGPDLRPDELLALGWLLHAGLIEPLPTRGQVMPSRAAVPLIREIQCLD